SLTKNADANTINPLVPEKHITAGDNVTLSCKYSGTVNTLQWYRQYPGSRIEFLIFATELSGQSEHALRLSSTADRGNKQMHLNIFLTEMEDSAIYYCALSSMFWQEKILLFPATTVAMFKIYSGIVSIPDPNLRI
uniref:T-cell receptor alpha/delta variable 7.0 n=1 Tax=Cyprinus carpio carpio TaxID=630221 RepID=A0A9J8D6R9_CYPCA